MTDSDAFGPTLLVVDDEPLVLMMAEAVLEDAGYRVFAAGSAEDALRLVDDGLRPDALITDHSLPGMSGSDLAVTLGSRLGLQSVLVCTGHGASSFDWPILAKPYREGDLLRQVELLLRRSD